MTTEEIDALALRKARETSRHVTLSTFTADEHEELVYDIIATYVASLPPARVEEGPRVKALEWVVRPNYTFLAAECISTVGYYAIYNVSDGFQWDYDHKDKGRAKTLDEVKAAAQAHYEARIRGALE